MDEFDLLVIGSGPGGQRAAIQGAKLGLRTAIIERRGMLGGVSTHTGTIPSKTLREAVLYLCGWREKDFYGQDWRVRPEITAADIRQRLAATVKQQVRITGEQLARNDVERIEGSARFEDSHTLAIEDADGETRLCRGKHIVIATGTTARRPTGIPFNERSIIDSDGILELPELPRRLTVIGAGVIGVEYATIFSALDIDITLVDARARILDFADADVVAELVADMRARGIRILLEQEVIGVDEGPPCVTRLAGGERIESDLVMVTAGRTGATAGLALANAGLEADKRGRIRVDEQYRTAVPHIFAVGDVIGQPALASTAAEQGRRAVRHAVGIHTFRFPEVFPWGIYSVPEISMVGSTEDELRQAGVEFETGVARLEETARAQIQGATEGLLKLLFKRDDQRLLGVHIIGEGATELVHIGQAVLMHGSGLAYFVRAVFNYPTLAEAYKVAALEVWNRLPHDP